MCALTVFLLTSFCSLLTEQGSDSFLDRSFCLRNDGAVVFVREYVCGVGYVHPPYFRYLILLRYKINIFRLCKEVHHHFYRVLFRRICNSLPESRVDYHINGGLLHYLTACSLHLSLTAFYVSFRERPVTAVDMLYQQYLGIAVIFTINNSSA